MDATTSILIIAMLFDGHWQANDDATIKVDWNIPVAAQEVILAWQLISSGRMIATTLTIDDWDEDPRGMLLLRELIALANSSTVPLKISDCNRIQNLKERK